MVCVNIVNCVDIDLLSVYPGNDESLPIVNAHETVYVLLHLMRLRYNRLSFAWTKRDQREYLRNKLSTFRIET